MGSLVTRDKTLGTGVAAGSILITVAFGLSLFLFWNANIIELGENFLGSDSFIIVNKIFHSHELKWFEQTYLSQFGLQGVLLAKLHNQPFNYTVIGISTSASVLFSILTALAFSIPVSKINNISGFPAVALYWVSMAFSPWLLQFSYSLYWVPFTIVIPALITLCLGTWMHDKRKWFVLTFVCIAMVVKCLCGYEYITTITLFACGGYVFSLIRTGLKVRVSSLSLIFAACVVGFFIALFIHVLQLHHISDGHGLSTIMHRAEAHTGTDGGGDDPTLLIARLASRAGNEDVISILSTSANDHKLLFAWTAFKEYFHLPALAFYESVIPFGWFIFIAFIASFICLSHLFASLKNRFSCDVKLFSFGVAFIFLGVFSWQILAWHHMTVHYHLNGQLFAYGIVPVSMVIIGSIINIGYKKLPEVIKSKITFLVGLILCLVLIVITVFNNGNSKSLKDDYQAFESSTSKVIANLDNIHISDGGSELYRGMEKNVKTITVSGWMYSTGRDNPRIFVMIKGGLIGEIKPSIRRDDVFSVYPEAGLFNGFNFSYTIPGDLSREDVHLLIPDGNGNYVELK